MQANFYTDTEMDIESLHEYCIGKKGVTESFPFDDQTLVYKVGGKIFLLIGLNNPVSFNAKCDPERAVTLREQFDEIKPGYHMNKVHWNTVNIRGHLSLNLIKELIDHSYDLVFKCLPVKVRNEIINSES